MENLHQPAKSWLVRSRIWTVGLSWAKSLWKRARATNQKLAYGTRMKVTVAKYYTPSGRCVQRLDYSHRDDAGKVHAQADSTLKTFYTTSGREVIEGRGVIQMSKSRRS